MDDPHLPVPTLRRLAAGGATAKGMRPVNPTVTWPNHTSMVTGVTPSKHGVLFNGILMRTPGMPPRIEPWRDKKEMVRVRTLYDAAHDAKLTTAQVDWVAIQNAPTVTWEFAERPDAKGAIGRELVAAGKISEEDLAAFASRNIVYRDHIWTEAAVHILTRHRPNLLMFHLLNLDSTQHRYGPRTPAAMTTMALLDSQVARIVGTLESTGLMPRTTVFVVADHGFKAVRRQIRPNAAFMKAGLLTVTGRESHAGRGLLGARRRNGNGLRDRGRYCGYDPRPREGSTARSGRHREGHRAERIRRTRLAGAVRQRADGCSVPSGRGGICIHRRPRRSDRRRRFTRLARCPRLRVHRSRSAGAVHRVRSRDQAGYHARHAEHHRSGAHGGANCSVSS